MDKSVKDYFHEFEGGGSETGHYHSVLALHESNSWDWEKLKALAPSLPRGWFELSQLSSIDRIEFSRDHWLNKLPFQPHLLERLDSFFGRLDDIGIFITKHTEIDDKHDAHLVYSIKENGGFFHGLPPASETEIASLQEQFTDTLLPEDYFAFCRIHNRFKKCADTGIISLKDIPSIQNSLQDHICSQPPIYLKNGEQLNPKSLIPFYESFGCHSYQCFYSEWYPENEMGNIYYSGSDHTISQTSSSREEAELNLAFPTFLDWLLFYLEGIE